MTSRLYLETSQVFIVDPVSGSDSQPSGALPGSFKTANGCYDWLQRYVDAGNNNHQINITGQNGGFVMAGPLVGQGGKSITINLNGRLDGVGSGGDAGGLWVGFGAVVTITGNGNITSEHADCIRVVQGANLTIAGTRANGNALSLGQAAGAQLFCGQKGFLANAGQGPADCEMWVAGDSANLVLCEGQGQYDAGGTFIFWSGSGGPRHFSDATVRVDTQSQMWNADPNAMAFQYVNCSGVQSPWRCIVDNAGIVFNARGNRQFFPGGNISGPLGTGDVLLANGGVYSSE